MKVKAKIKVEDTFSPEAMPVALQEKLNGMSINEGIEAGLIKSLGDETGQFVWDHADEGITTLYGIVNDYRVTLSNGLKDSIDDIEGILGKLRFKRDISNQEGPGKGMPYFRLGLPAGIRLGKAVVTLSEEVFEDA